MRFTKLMTCRKQTLLAQDGIKKIFAADTGWQKAKILHKKINPLPAECNYTNIF